MRHQLSLKLVVALAFVSMAIVLVFGYSLLSSHFYRKGLDAGTSLQMEDAARRYVQSLPGDKRHRLTTFSGYQIAQTWQQLPRQIREAFNEQPPSAREPFGVKMERSGLFGPPDALTFVFRYDDGNETLFVGRRAHRPPGPNLLGKNARDSRRMLFLLSGAIAGVLAVTILLLLRHFAKPVAALEQWAGSLGPENLTQPPPDFSYPELNKLAGLVRSSLSSVEQGLERERRFLRYASHELRTPITIIRNNTELFSKIEKLQEPQRTLQQSRVVERIDRASLNMQHLTETLLWLSKETIEQLPLIDVELDQMLEQLVDDMKYLIDKKDITLRVDISPCTLRLPKIPAQIVLGNLLRNAFQHTWEGNITLYQRGNSVEICNSQAEGDTPQQDLGFGLGLQLTAQLAEKLDWDYRDESEQSIRKVSISFKSVETDMENQ